MTVCTCDGGYQKPRLRCDTCGKQVVRMYLKALKPFERIALSRLEQAELDTA